MEKETITIEIRQEVSVALLWIAAGVVLITGTFFLAPKGVELWPAVNAAGIAAFVYLVALLFFVLRKPLSAQRRLVLALLGVLFLASTAYRWVQMQDETRWQADQILRIRGVIGRGIMMTEMSGPLLKTLDAFHRQGPAKKNSLAEEFKKIYPATSAGSSIYKPKWDGDGMRIIVTELNPDKVVLVSQETFVKGRDPSFKNLDGKAGLIQEQYTLTAKGIVHVSEN
ncbi:MAG: hypothetical protein NTU47_03055 [Ignavibacteriales bacterium]|nr:hypothetical protein [Ignavibacteriales bacterium]